MAIERRQIVALVAIVACAPLLQGAGCRTHYSARLRGQLLAAPKLGAEHAGKQIRVIYRKRTDAARACDADWAPCLRDAGWLPLHSCDALEPTEGHTPVAKVTPDGAAQSFDACTRMVGVDYRADIAAFIDSNGDEKPSAGEPYGVYAGNPLTRDREAQALPLKIELDRAMPP